MNNNYEKRMMLIFGLAFVMIIGYYFFMPKKTMQRPPVQNTSQVSTNTGTVSSTASTMPENEIAYLLRKNLSINTNLPKTSADLNFQKQMFMTIDTYGGRISKLSIDGKWNRHSEPVSVIASNTAYLPGDVSFSSLEQMQNNPERPVYRIIETNSNSVTMLSTFKFKGSNVELRKKFSIGTNYQFFEEITVKNNDQAPVKLDINGKSLIIGASFTFFSKDLANSSNPLIESYFDGKNISQTGGFLKANTASYTIPNPSWLSVRDNYFIAFMKPEFGDASGRYYKYLQEKVYNEIAMGIELPVIFLEGGESRTYKISYYVGPKKEGILSKIDNSYSKLFAWPAVFNWFMKPIELGITFIMNFLANFISNWGLTIIVLALLIKLILMPLSVKAAVSIKRSNLLQPKMKQLQDRYKDDPKTLNEKIAELYKKEGVNPLEAVCRFSSRFRCSFPSTGFLRIRSISGPLNSCGSMTITQPDTLFPLEFIRRSV